VARTVEWSETATLDLEEAADFIARDSRYYAAALVRDARAAARSLKTLAERGRIVPEARSPDIREIPVKSFRLIYWALPIECPSSPSSTVAEIFPSSGSAAEEPQIRKPDPSARNPRRG